MKYFSLSAAVLLTLFLFGSDARADELNSKDIITKSNYEVNYMVGYGWAMDRLKQEPQIENAIFTPSIAVPLTTREMGSSFYRGIVQYQCELTAGAITKPKVKGEIGLSFIGFKYNFTDLESRWSPYASFGFGGIYEPIGHHVQGSDWNFLLQTGIGIQCFLSDKTAINVQYRYRHISNANIKSPNSSINSSFVMIGLSYF